MNTEVSVIAVTLFITGKTFIRLTTATVMKFMSAGSAEIMITITKIIVENLSKMERIFARAAITANMKTTMIMRRNKLC